MNPWPQRRFGGPAEVVAAAAALVVGLLLRLAQYRDVPWPAPNPDEWNWAWAGLSQFEGLPSTAWSIYWYLYPASVRSPSPAPFNQPLVHPYIDAPPLFSWLVGTVAYLGGDRTVDQVAHDPRYRLLAIALSLAALALAYLLGRLVIGVLPALAGLWLLASGPLAVLMGRLVAAEHVLAILLLIGALAVYGLRRDPADRRLQAALLACCLVAPAVKAPGLSVGVSAFVLLASRRQLRLALLAGGAMVVGEGLTLAYTALLDWHTYAAEVSARGAQLTGYTGYSFIVAVTGFDAQHTVDGWWFLGWLGIAEIIGRRRHGDLDLLVVPPVVWMLAMLGFATYYSASYGWYRIGVMPIVYLAAGRFLWLAVAELSLVRLAVVAVAALATVANFAPALGIGWGPLLLGFATLAALLPGLAVLVRPSARRYAFGFACLLLALLVPLNAEMVAALGYVYGH